MVYTLQLNNKARAGRALLFITSLFATRQSLAGASALAAAGVVF